ncbi:MAG: gliding motility-associated ABC transporter substrate-binding protein GldG [Flavobacteriales bacterium]|nr:gliding motility-associated ABC transporter substrate-binding protein GldG [Flavobacteriales bacterium]
MNTNKYITSILFITLVFLVNILCSFINWDIDLTADKKHSFAKETTEIINSLEDNLFIKVYLEGDFPADFKKLQKATEELLKRFKSISSDNIDFEFINPNTPIADDDKLALFKQLVKLKLTPTDLEIRKEGKQVNQVIFPGALIYYKDKKVAVNFLKQKLGESPGGNINTSIENLEYEFVSAIQYLIKNKLDKIAFLEGNGELSENEVHDITSSVLDDNFNLSYYYNIDRFNIKEFTIDSTTMLPNLSRQLAMMNVYKVIIIAKPTIPFNNLDKLLIDQYVMQGGKVLWLVDGVIASMDSLQNKSGAFIATKNNLNIDDQLLKYGVRINADLIEDLRSTKIPIITGYSNNKPQQSYFQWPYFPLLVSDSKHAVSKGLDGIKCDFVSSIDMVKNNIQKTILLHSSKQSRLNLAPAKISLGILENPPSIESYNKQFKPIAVLLEGEFESVFKDKLMQKNNQIQLKEKSEITKMIVVSDGDLIANNVSASGTIFPLAYDPNIKYTYPGNKHFLINAIQYLCDENGLSHLKTKELSLRMLDKEKIQKNKFLIQLINIIFPIVLLLIFAFLFIRNKKRKYA